jgi:hypothetical protein
MASPQRRKCILLCLVIEKSVKLDLRIENSELWAEPFLRSKQVLSHWRNYENFVELVDYIHVHKSVQETFLFAYFVYLSLLSGL